MPIKHLKQLFDSLLGGTGSPAEEEHQLQLATAVMLVEVMRADPSFHAGERQAVLNALCNKFSLNATEAERLTELAETEAKNASDWFGFTSKINESFAMPQKLRVIEYMWQVAYADGHLSEHERHVMWRLSDLLHIPQGAYIHAKLRAQASAGLSD